MMVSSLDDFLRRLRRRRRRCGCSGGLNCLGASNTGGAGAVATCASSLDPSAAACCGRWRCGGGGSAGAALLGSWLAMLLLASALEASESAKNEPC